MSLFHVFDILEEIPKKGWCNWFSKPNYKYISSMSDVIPGDAFTDVVKGPMFLISIDNTEEYHVQSEYTPVRAFCTNLRNKHINLAGPRKLYVVTDTINIVSNPTNPEPIKTIRMTIIKITIDKNNIVTKIGSSKNVYFENNPIIT